MLPLILGLMFAAVIVTVTMIGDPVGLGWLLSSDVGAVADARLAEPVQGMPLGYLAAAGTAGAGAVLSFPMLPAVSRWILGVLIMLWIVGTLWDMRRRRGTLAVYIRMRRAEIGFEPRGDVIEVPRLVFLVMNQPTPLVWLATAIGLAGWAALLYPVESWGALIPLTLLAIGLFWLWLRNRHSLWEPLARHLRWLSLRNGDRLLEPLQESLDIDPEVRLLRVAAEQAVIRFMSRNDEEA